MTRSIMLDETSVLPTEAAGDQPGRWAKRYSMATDKEVVRGHEPAVGRHDTETVGVGVVAGGDLELMPTLYERGHSVRRRAVGANFPVPIEGHEPPGRVHQSVDDGQVQPVALADGAPVVDAGTAERVGADADAGCRHCLEVDGRG